MIQLPPRSKQVGYVYNNNSWKPVPFQPDRPVGPRVYVPDENYQQLPPEIQEKVTPFSRVMTYKEPKAENEDEETQEETQEEAQEETQENDQETQEDTQEETKEDEQDELEKPQEPAKKPKYKKRVKQYSALEILNQREKYQKRLKMLKKQAKRLSK